MTGRRVLVVGGTGFVGRHTARAFAERGDEVTVCSRGETEWPFETDEIARVRADRTDEEAFATVARQVDPDIVVDCAAYRPEAVRTATRLFDDADAYVYVSSGAAYRNGSIPKREDESPLCEYDETDGEDAYGPRKAAGDRAVFEAASDGVAAMVVRPSNVYGPGDYSGYMAYWVDRVEQFDRVLVPGDGDALWHRAYVKDVARALVRVAADGTPGEAYNVAERQATTLSGLLERIAGQLDTAVEQVHASPRELAAANIDPRAFPYYRDEPHLLSTAKLAALGWESTPVEEALAVTIEASEESDRDRGGSGPDRAATERVLDALDTR